MIQNVIICQFCYFRMHPMFNVDEEVLWRHDSTFTGVGDTKDVDPEVLHSILKFIETNTEECIDSIHVDTDMKDSFGVKTSTDGNKYDVPDTIGTLLDLKWIGDGIWEQCKMIADVTYNMEDAETGNIVLSQLCDVYNYFYKNCQNHKGILGVCKDNLKFRTLTGKRKNKGFFRQHRIIPLFPSKYRKQKASKFGRKSNIPATQPQMIYTQQCQMIGREQHLMKCLLFLLLLYTLHLQITTWTWNLVISHHLWIWRHTKAKMTWNLDGTVHQVCGGMIEKQCYMPGKFQF